MNDISINSASFSFIGLFQYSDKKIIQNYWKQDFEVSDFYEENADYFQQKYYDNFLNSLFCKVCDDNQPNHFALKKGHSIIGNELSLNFYKDNIESTINYSIRNLEVFLFPDNLGVFVIKIDLPKSHCNWDDISNFGWEFRQTTVNKKRKEIPHVVGLVERHIIESFNSDVTHWRKYNPNLKTGFFIDINKQPNDTELNTLLFSVGTFINPNNKNDAYQLHASYKEQQIDKYSISIYNNWKVLCLYDTLTRIACDLNKEDKYKLWENEYILIYIYVIYTRFHLHDINKQLANVNSKNWQLTKTRNIFLSFINTYDHTKISYKFLPNDIYKQFKISLDIDDEIDSIKEKISRMNNIRQEKNGKRLNRILLILTLLTLVSVSYDGGQWLGRAGENMNAFIISLAIFFSAAILLTIVYIYFKKKK